MEYRQVLFFLSVPEDRSVSRRHRGRIPQRTKCIHKPMFEIDMQTLLREVDFSGLKARIQESLGAGQVDFRDVHWRWGRKGGYRPLTGRPLHYVKFKSSLAHSPRICTSVYILLPNFQPKEQEVEPRFMPVFQEREESGGNSMRVAPKPKQFVLADEMIKVEASKGDSLRSNKRSWREQEESHGSRSKKMPRDEDSGEARRGVENWITKILETYPTNGCVVHPWGHCYVDPCTGRHYDLGTRGRLKSWARQLYDGDESVTLWQPPLDGSFGREWEECARPPLRLPNEAASRAAPREHRPELEIDWDNITLGQAERFVKSFPPVVWSIINQHRPSRPSAQDQDQNGTSGPQIPSSKITDETQSRDKENVRLEDNAGPEENAGSEENEGSEGNARSEEDEETEENARSEEDEGSEENARSEEDEGSEENAGSEEDK